MNNMTDEAIIEKEMGIQEDAQEDETVSLDYSSAKRRRSIAPSKTSFSTSLMTRLRPGALRTL